MSAVTHTRVDEEVVRPTMDGIALNHWQALALHNPATPEVDSLLEWIDTLHLHGVAPAIVDQGRERLWLVVELNGRERQCHRAVAGAGEEIVHDLRPVDGRQSLKRPALRRRLRPILDVIADPSADPMAYVRAGRDLVLLQREVPLRTLLSRSLERELGPNAELLHRYLREDGC